MERNKIDLSMVSFHDLQSEVKRRQENAIEQAVNMLNNAINTINMHGISVEHASDCVELLPKFRIERYPNGQISLVTYEDQVVRNM